MTDSIYLTRHSDPVWITDDVVYEPDISLYSLNGTPFGVFPTRLRRYVGKFHAMTRDQKNALAVSYLYGLRKMSR